MDCSSWACPTPLISDTTSILLPARPTPTLYHTGGVAPLRHRGGLRHKSLADDFGWSYIVPHCEREFLYTKLLQAQSCCQLSPRSMRERRVHPWRSSPKKPASRPMRFSRKHPPHRRRRSPTAQTVAPGTAGL